jgi:hypothetical protein
MSVKNLPLPESLELNNYISIDSIRSLINNNILDLDQVKLNEIVFRIATLIGFKDEYWNNHFKQFYKIH